MQQLIRFIIILFAPSWLSAQYFSPLDGFFNSDGTSIYGAMTLDSIDVLDWNTKEVKVAYNENCQVKSMAYLLGITEESTNRVDIEYHAGGGPKLRTDLRITFKGFLIYDTSWYDLEGRTIKFHETNSVGGLDRFGTTTYDDEGRILTRYYSQLVDTGEYFLHQIEDLEYVYVDDNHIEEYRFFSLEQRIAVDSIYKLCFETETSFLFDDGKIMERVSLRNGAEVVLAFKYDDEDRLIETTESYNGTIRKKSVYTYSDMLPVCEDWTNDIWEAEPAKEVKTVTYYDNRHLELRPFQRTITATNDNDKEIFEFSEVANALGDWETISKRLIHYDSKGGTLYSVDFETVAGVTRPKYLFAYETNDANQLTRSERVDYISATNSWSEVTYESLVEYTANGSISSRMLTYSDGEFYNYTWEYTDFGAFILRTYPDGESNYFYSERCKAKEYTNLVPLLYPNPVSELLTVDHDDPDQLGTFKIYTLTGALVTKELDLRSPINVSWLASGVYILQGSLGGEVWQQKFVKI